MTKDSIMQEIKEGLQSRPGEPTVLGVCQVLSKRFDHEVWKLRLAFLVLVVFWTLPVMAAYIILGFLMSETESRTRGFFCGLQVLIQETAVKVFAALGGIFGSDGNSESRSNSY
jgi:phage shock protein PspC (stress-responsive transcriptional regulator)